MASEEIVVFLGPTIALGEARSRLEATYRPPVAQGDILRACRDKPFAIGIVDGYFERVPSVWHKEILWALSEGVHVWGAASMGALRAVELARFGMHGVGQVYSWFASGGLEDDDEVAVAHAGAESNFRAASEAMVNVRATLARARNEGVVSEETRARVEAAAKAMFYPDRVYPGILRRARESGAVESELAALVSFISRRRVDVKADDARLLLDALGELRVSRVPALEAGFTLAHTDAWEHLQRNLEAPLGAEEPGHSGAKARSSHGEGRDG